MLEAFIIGSSGFAKEVYNWVDHSQVNIVGFLNEYTEGNKTLFNKPILKNANDFNCKNVILGVGDPSLKEKFWIKLKEEYRFLPVIHKTAIIGSDVHICDGVIMCPNVVITTKCYIGIGCTLNLGVTIGHDCVISSFCTFSPGVNISGNCSIGESVYFGTNSSLREKMYVEKQSVIGMGAVVVKPIYESGTYLGNPAKKVEK